MPRITGAHLPAELVLYIAENFFELARDIFFHRSSAERTREKSGLLAPSLVCRHWAGAIRPVLFRYLILRTADDVCVLKDIVSGPEFNRSGLAKAVRQVDVLCLTTAPRCFLPLLHGLAASLRRAIFHCHVHPGLPAPGISAGLTTAPTTDTTAQSPLPGTPAPATHANANADAAVAGPTNEDTSTDAAVEKHWAPFAAVPGVPPTYVKLTLLTLVGVHFADARALARLADAFAALSALSCDALVFDAPPAAPANAQNPPAHNAQQAQHVQQAHARHVRRGPRTLWSVRLSRCAGLDLAAHARLASYIVSADARLGLAERDWEALLDALSACAPEGWQQVEVALREREGRRAGLASLGFSPEFTVGEDAIIANVQVSSGEPSVSTSPAAQVTAINLSTSCTAHTPTSLPSLDALQTLAPALQRLHLWARPRRNQFYESDTRGLKAIMRAVLKGDALGWALDAGLLQCLCGVEDDRPWPKGDVIGVKDIRAVHDGTAWEGEGDGDGDGGLGVDEKVEWLVRIAPEERARYLRQVRALRAVLRVAADRADQAKSVASVDMAGEQEVIVIQGRLAEE
ncbi:hypothetical protein PsYK624_118000 [Phanerochaete sordida]|uniref:Uncharacterized protein n=1 Tax=Phanerochaete sordida TaxID=48140 RepID=A0A9P3GLF0_9APHY|nr:hypothetical protein PsYK624_118000 [Phanerochaete sordida]